MHFDSDNALQSFITAFENGSFPKSQWTHSSHLAMATAYLWLFPIHEATALIRHGIQTYNVAQGGVNSPESGYHETLTIFWIQRVAEIIAELPAEAQRLDAVRAVVDRYGHRRDVFNDYYSFDVVKSMEARARWVAPDLK